VVTEKDFAVAYERHAACLPSDNIFTAKNWQQIDPAHARADITEPVKKARSRRDGK
jgi:hypothetical protein